MAEENEDGGAEPTVEERARAQGWVPKDDYKGDPSKWRDAEEFVKRGEEIASFRPETVRKLEGQVAKLQRRLDEQADFYTKQQQRAYERALADIKTKQEAAVETGDKDAFKAAEAQAEQVRKDMAEAKPKDAAPETDEHTQAWLEQNKWFHAPAIGQKGHKRASAYAVAVAEEADEEGLRGAAMYARVTKEVREKFPELFENLRRKDPPAVEGGGTPTRGGKGRTLADLPPEHRKIMRDTVAQIQKRNPKYTEADWLQQYQWD